MEALDTIILTHPFLRMEEQIQFLIGELKGKKSFGASYQLQCDWESHEKGMIEVGDKFFFWGGINSRKKMCMSCRDDTVEELEEQIEKIKEIKTKP